MNPVVNHFPQTPQKSAGTPGNSSPSLSVPASISEEHLQQEIRRLPPFYPIPAGEVCSFHQIDRCRLMMNKEHQEFFAANELLSFDALMTNLPEEKVLKNKLAHRVTSQFSLKLNSEESRTFYIKRHTPAPAAEYLKNWCRLRPSYLGAKHEWQAILNFRKQGIPTLTPVAVGSKGRRSFLVTEALYNMVSVADWLTTRPAEGELYTVIKAMARLTRLMHGSGLHHQDYYFDHLYIPINSDIEQIHLIDLGRAEQKSPLTEYWVIKDLAQWNYAARRLAPEFRHLFFEFYFGTISQPVLHRLTARIQKKTAAIARHSARHSLG